MFSAQLLLVFCLFAPFSAQAHDPFVAEIRGQADASSLTLRLTFDHAAAALCALELDDARSSRCAPSPRPSRNSGSTYSNTATTTTK